MSKKTDAAKLWTRFRFWAHRRHPRKKSRINEIGLSSHMGKVFADPIFLAHVAGALLRFLELEYPVELQISRTLNDPLPPLEGQFMPLETPCPPSPKK